MRPGTILATFLDDGDDPFILAFDTPDEYAQWAETNHLTDAYPNPTALYGLTAKGRLHELTVKATVGDFYDSEIGNFLDDVSTVTYYFTFRDTGEEYDSGGCAIRNGLA